MFNKSPDELETDFRKDPQSFARDFESAELAAPDAPDVPGDPVAATWRARLQAEGLLGCALEHVSFTYPAAIASAISLMFLVPYWVTGEIQMEWAFPWLGPFAFLPLMAWHAERVEDNRGWHVFAGAAAVSVLVAVQWEFLQGVNSRALLVQALDLMMFHAPNRLTVLVGNILFLGTLLALLRSYIPVKTRPWPSPAEVLNRAFPVYIVWTVFVVILLPLFYLSTTNP